MYNNSMWKKHVGRESEVNREQTCTRTHREDGQSHTDVGSWTQFGREHRLRLVVISEVPRHGGSSGSSGFCGYRARYSCRYTYSMTSFTILTVCSVQARCPYMDQAWSPWQWQWHVNASADKCQNGGCCEILWDHHPQRTGTATAADQLCVVDWFIYLLYI